MPLLVSSAEARRRLEYMCQANADPTLEEQEIIDLLADHAVVSVWTAATAYEYGAEVVPTADKRNGRRYRVVEFDGSGRTSGATEPAWSDYPYARHTDGDITWEESGSMPSSLWDLNRAAAEGWRIKAAKAAEQYDHADADHKESASQLHQHCLTMLKSFAVVEVG